MSQKILIFISLIFITSVQAWAQDSQVLGMSERDIDREIVELRQRKLDFQKHLQASLSDPSAQIRVLKKEQLLQQQEAEKARVKFVHEQKKVTEPDAEEREKIEAGLQEKLDALNDKNTKAYNKLRERREKRLSAAHVEIDENLEYDIQIPIKANRAKSKPNKAKSSFKTESF